MQHFNVSPAQPEHREEAVALWRACGLVVSYNDPVADFDFAMAGANSNVLIAREGQGPIGGALMVGHDGHRGWVYYVGADPARRSAGIGRALMEAAERWLSERGVRKLQLLVRETNTQVVEFYERLGYEHTPRVVMAKWLDTPED